MKSIWKRKFDYKGPKDTLSKIKEYLKDELFLYNDLRVCIEEEISSIDQDIEQVMKEIIKLERFTPGDKRTIRRRLDHMDRLNYRRDFLELVSTHLRESYIDDPEHLIKYIEERSTNNV